MPSSPIEVLLQRLEGGGSDKPKAALVHPMAQAEILRQAFAQITQPEPLPPGYLCREKPLFHFVKEDRRPVFVVVRALDPRSDFDRALIEQYLRETSLKLVSFAPDVVCADVFSSNGMVATFSLHYSGALQLVTDAELADWPLPPIGEGE